MRSAKTGRIRQAHLQIARAAPRIHEEAWEGLGTAFEETGPLPSFHVVVFGAGGALLGMAAHLQDRTASNPRSSTCKTTVRRTRRLVRPL